MSMIVDRNDMNDVVVDGADMNEALTKTRYACYLFL